MTAEQPTLTVAPPISVEAFERLVYGGRREDAMLQLLQIIQGVKNGAGFELSGGSRTMEMLFTRLASAITALFADPNVDITYDGFAMFAGNHPTFHSIFRVSAFGGTDHLVNLIGQRETGNPANVGFPTAGQLHKLLLCWSLDSEVDFDFEQLATVMPEFVSAALVGILGIGGIHTQRAYDRKLALLKKWPLITAAMPNENMVLPMCDVYMHCSYVDAVDKHDIKRALNGQFRRLVEAKALEHNRPVVERYTLERKERPTLVIPVEWFGSHHAMYRCYAPAIRQLREHFYVVGIARVCDIDEVSEKEFDKCVKIQPEKQGIFDFYDAVAGESPDVLFYPSIGMAGWWVALSNFRLAPLQIMCPGHPATTRSSCIDYIVSDGDLFGDHSRYSEKCWPLPVGTTRYINSTKVDRRVFTRHIQAGEVVRVAIPAMAMKLVPPFLAALKRIKGLVGKKFHDVEFHFFPNMIAAFQHLITADIREWVPNAIIHERKTYPAYIDTLAQCDLMLSSFPFCGTNSVIDAFLCNMPVIALEGNEIHERSGASMIRRIGLPEKLIAHTVDEYVDIAVELIENQFELNGYQTYLESTDVEAEFYGDGPDELRGEFGKAFLTIYQRECDKHEHERRRISDSTADASAGVSAADL